MRVDSIVDKPARSLARLLLLSHHLTLQASVIVLDRSQVLRAGRLDR
jgi:hypothetical protein